MWGHQHHEQKAESLSCEHPLFLVFCQERIELCVWDLVGKVFLGMWLCEGRGEAWQEGPVFLSSWGYGIIWGVRGVRPHSLQRIPTLSNIQNPLLTQHILYLQTEPSGAAWTQRGTQLSLGSTAQMPHTKHFTVWTTDPFWLNITPLNDKSACWEALRLTHPLNDWNKSITWWVICDLFCFNKGCPEQSRRLNAFITVILEKL